MMHELIRPSSSSRTRSFSLFHSWAFSCQAFLSSPNVCQWRVTPTGHHSSLVSDTKNTLPSKAWPLHSHAPSFTHLLEPNNLPLVILDYSPQPAGFLRLLASRQRGPSPRGRVLVVHGGRRVLLGDDGPPSRYTGDNSWTYPGLPS